MLFSSGTWVSCVFSGLISIFVDYWLSNDFMCFASMSYSRLTLSLVFNEERFVFPNVCLISDTSRCSLSKCEIVKLTPFMLIDPFGVRYFWPALLYFILITF
mgnify:CR=1 FL=1